MASSTAPLSRKGVRAVVVREELQQDQVPRTEGYSYASVVQGSTTPSAPVQTAPPSRTSRPLLPAVRSTAQALAVPPLAPLLGPLLDLLLLPLLPGLLMPLPYLLGLLLDLLPLPCLLGLLLDLLALPNLLGLLLDLLPLPVLLVLLPPLRLSGQYPTWWRSCCRPCSLLVPHCPLAIHYAPSTFRQ